MRPYPLVPLCIVRANMGVGKTKEMFQSFLPAHCKKKKTRCLLVTYQRILSYKYAIELNELGFHNYIDLDHDIHEDRVIICLDSLSRIKNPYFDFIIVDEVTSVLLHFNSKFIKNSSVLCCKLEGMLLRCKFIYLLDACADNTIVYDFANMIAIKKNITPYFIKNAFVRKTNRYCNLTIASNHDCADALKNKIIAGASEKLKVGQNVVITCSTKSSAACIAEALKRKLPHKKILLYHSESELKITIDNLHQFVKEWAECDALIYSPTITAGISFEVPHFHSLFAYIENSFMAPPVDGVLQQLFRVRQLKDGEMNIFLYDHDLNDSNLPVTPNDVDDFLQHEADDINRYYPKDCGLHIFPPCDCHSTHNRVLFETKVL